jgi:hypothetical protein
LDGFSASAVYTLRRLCEPICRSRDSPLWLFDQGHGKNFRFCLIAMKNQANILQKTIFTLNLWMKKKMAGAVACPFLSAGSI